MLGSGSSSLFAPESDLSKKMKKSQISLKKMKNMQTFEKAP